MTHTQNNIIFSTDDYRDILKKHFEMRQARNSSYTLRSFARDLDISVTALSQVLAGIRHFSKKNLLKIERKLSIDLEKSKEEIKQDRFSKGQEKDEKIKEDEFHLIADWYHLAILSMAKRKNMLWDVEVIANTLGIDSSLVEEALQRLVDLHFIEKKEGFLCRIVESITTFYGTPSMAIKKYHSDHLHIIRHHLEKTPFHLREYGSLTFNLKRESLDEFRKLLHDFRKKVLSRLGDDQGDLTYNLNMYFYPSNIREEQKEEDV
jgi:transcriptional regulator with XRE-family HTH domain